MDNQKFGTIRPYQERHHPGHISGAQLTNPDFALMAQAFGGFGVRVETAEEIKRALEQALEEKGNGRFAVIHLIVEQRKQVYL